ncbi:dockerin type I domain-containing protein [Neorhodopirellula pilleata]|uniref:Lactonase, 7-bladed beta-propeller n=1 Tax=Neorhodopirellula pilleata TaxID=2714738 RepID=A0A5C5ZZV7_9BACT|nr:dockerin type I domain-containing protein [Neorhodopirellula pilleata]TWT92561.1 Lactonase, 7-bladed beta-propeller [Neorhodopirellula pilleata]
MALFPQAKSSRFQPRRRSLTVQKLDPRVVFAAELDLQVNLQGSPAETIPGQVIVPGSAIVWDYQITNTGDQPIAGLRVLQNAGTPADPSDDFEPALVPNVQPAPSIAASGTLVATFANTRVDKMVSSPWQPRLYATIPNEDMVAVYNTKTSTLIRSVDLNYAPSGLTLSADASTLYVAAFSESLDRGRIFILDAGDLDEIDSIIVPGVPRDVRVGADGRLIVLTDRELLQINPATGDSVSDSIPVEFSRGELAINPARDRLYVASIGAPWASLTQYDLTADPPRVLWQSPTGPLTGSNGQDLTISHDGRFVSYAAGNGQGGYRIAKYDTLSDMNIIGHFETGAFPREITYSPDDAIAYTVSRSGVISAWDTGDFQLADQLSVIGEARELSVDSTGRYLYAAFDDGLRVYSTGRTVAINIGDENQNGLVDPGERWSYTSEGVADTGPTQTISLATGINPQGNPVTAVATSYYTGESISVTLASTLQGEAVTATSSPLHAIDKTLLWRHSVTNTGTAALSQVNLRRDGIDSNNRYLAGDVNENGQFDPNETWIYEVQEIATAGIQTRVVQFNAVSASGDAPVAFNESEIVGYFGVDSSVELRSLINGQVVGVEPGSEIGVGDPATLVYQISNTGNVSLSSVTLIEDNGTARNDDDFSPIRAQGDTNANDELDPGETWIYLIEQTAVAGTQQRNLALTATDPLDRQITAETPAHYVGVGGNVDLVVGLIAPENPLQHPATESALVPTGELVRLQYLVTNAGTLPLGNPTLVDDRATPNDLSDDLTPFRVNEDIGADGVLSPGETWDFRISFLAAEGLRSHRANVVVYPVDELGQTLDGVNPVSDTASSQYFGGTVDINANVRANGSAVDPERDDLFLADTMVQWTYEVTNTGNTAIESVRVVENPADETEEPIPTFSQPHSTQTGLSPRGTVMAEFDGVMVHRFVTHPTLPYVFASDFAGNRVLKINTNTLLIEQTYEMGLRPRGMSLSPDGNRLYVAHETSQTIGVLDIANNEILPSLSIAQVPRDVQVGIDGRLYVLGHQNLMQLNALTGEAVGPTLPVTVLGGEIAINPERTRLYYSNSNLTPASLYQIDLTTPSPTILYQSPADGSEGGNGQSLALSADGSLVAHAVSLPSGSIGGGGVATPVRVTVRKTSDMTLAGEYALADPAPGVFAREIAFDPEGRFAYATSQPNLISVFGATTFAQTSAIGIDGTTEEMEVDSTGRYLFASVGTRLVVYSTGRALSTINRGDVNFNRSFDPGETWIYGSSATVEPGSAAHSITAIATGLFGQTIAATTETTIVGAATAQINALVSGATVYNEDGLPETWIVSDDRFEISQGRLKLRDGEFLSADDDQLEVTLRVDEASDRIERSIVVSVSNEPAWQNTLDPADVNGDGLVTALDALIIINRLDAIESAANGNSLGVRPHDVELFYDVSGDSLITAVDALRVINALNASSTTPASAADSEPIAAVIELLSMEERKRREFEYHR